MIKRAFDFITALIGLAILGPLLLGVGCAIRLSSPGPAIYSQERVGRYGRRFRLYKFRSMIVDADTVGSPVTTSVDRRVTPIGRLLRKTKLDELPQLWNVLRGDLSLVGPRPDVPGFADQLSGPDRIILSVRPGITGPATLKFRDEEKLLAAQPDPEKYNREVIFPEKVRINREYVEHYSFWKDLTYIFQTVFGG